MKNLFQNIGITAFIIGFILFNAWCLMSVYAFGICPLVKEIGIVPPVLSYGFFLMFSTVLSYFQIEKEKEKLDLKTSEGWSKVLGNILTKLYMVGVICLLNIIIF